MTPRGADRVVVRAAEPGDAGLILALENEIFSEDPWTSGMIDEELASPVSAYILAVDEDGAGPVLGYAGVKVVGDGADVMTIGVLPSARGKGIGARLLSALVAVARDAGAEAIFLEVRESNEAAIGLYSRAGFDAIGRIRRYFRNPVEDAINMRLLVVSSTPESDPCPRCPSTP